MIKVFLTGFIVQDADIKKVGNRKAINIRIVVPLEPGKDGQERTEWVRAVIWKYDGQSTKIADYLKKGRKVLIEGIPAAECYTDKEGGTHANLHINIKDLEFLD